jgi:hypothetical protein
MTKYPFGLRQKTVYLRGIAFGNLWTFLTTCEIFPLHLDLNPPIYRGASYGALEDGSSSYKVIETKCCTAAIFVAFS